MTMSKKPFDKKSPDPELRKMAEGILANAPKAKTPALSAEHLLQELTVHQIELEMQNEALRQLQNELEASRDRYVNLYEFAPVGYLTLSTDGMIEEINLTGVTLLGVERAKLLRKGFTACVMPECYGRWLQHFTRVKESGKPETLELTLRRGDAVFHAQLDCVRQAEHTIGVVMIDISERKNAEAQLQEVHEQLTHAERLSALGKLTGTIAHEFNNPIYSVRNVLEQTLDQLEHNEELKPLLTSAIQECNQMADTVRKLRYFYQPADGTKTWVDINQTLDETILLLKKQLTANKIELKENYALHIHKVRVIEDQMKQAFMNLLQNAQEAISPEGGTIRVTTECPDDNNLKIIIEDTGKGIPPENLRRIFEPYFSAKTIKGAGLGLPVCHSIINSFGGKIEVRSELGKGAVFTIHIPTDSSRLSHNQIKGVNHG